jgi:arylsulfatase
MADDAIHWMKQLNDIDPEMPFFLHYVPGGTHAPHHPTPEWVKKISDKHLFDEGWNKLRDTIFANQKRLGVIPQDAQLTPWPHDLFKNWDELSDDEKKLFIRQADVYGAYLAYTDHEIGRVIQAVDDLGKLDNTLIIYISGDNGASAEGGLEGTPSEVMAFNGVNVPVADQLRYFYDAWGTQATYPHFAVPWAWAFDTPYKWTKQIPSFFGGTRQGMAISWPARIKDKGGVRWQFHHVIDIVPTILEVTGIPAPDTVDGIAQKPIEGVSLAYSSDRENADAHDPQDPVFRDVRRAGALRRRMDAERRADACAFGSDRSDAPGPRQRIQIRALRRAERLDAVHRRRGGAPAQGAGDDRLDVRRVRQVSGFAARLRARDAPRRAEAEPDRRAQGVRLLG